MADRLSFEELAPQILASLKAGASVADAARFCGTREGTVKHWLSKGRREPESKYGDFAAEADAIRAKRELPMLDGPVDDAEVEMHLSRAIRNGSVPAMKLWLEVYRPKRKADGDPVDPMAEFDKLAELSRLDQLAARRGAGGY